MDDRGALLQLLQGEKRRPFLVAVDGRCAAGKTTLAGELQAALGCNVVHMDDFYLPFSRRTAEQMARPGGNMDFDRLLSEVLLPLRSGESALYRHYDCHADRFLTARELDGSALTVVEGSYSCHPALRELYDLRVFLDISPETQERRLTARDPSVVEAFRTVWIPREEHYFDACQVRGCCGLVLRVE